MTPQEELQKVSEERDALLLTLEETVPTDAGFSLNFPITHEILGTGQVTFRRARSSEWMYAVRDARNFSVYALANGFKFSGTKSISAPSPSPTQAPQDEPMQVIQSVGVPALPDGAKAWLTIDASRVVVKPEPGDLVTIEFYAPGHKWPDLKANKWKIERAAGLLKHVTSHDVRKPADLSLSCTVYFLNGKEKEGKPGEFWKDVYHVRPDKF